MEQVNHFTLMGSLTTEDEYCEKELDLRWQVKQNGIYEYKLESNK